MLFKKLSFSAAALVATLGAAFAGGAFSQYPIVGVPANTTCLSYGNNGVCNQYAPIGPDEENGAWVVPTDTGAANGQNPQTVNTPIGLIGGINSKTNRLIGGDFNTNLWQRGTSFASQTPTTTLMTADRFGVYSSGNTVSVSKQTGAADTLPTLGLYAILCRCR